MPIARLTKPASFPEIGQLRKGAPKPESGNRPGKDLEWFRFTSDDQDALNMFLNAYGEQPARVDVFLPFATLDENFEAWCEEWTASSLKHRCDGVTCVRWLTPDGKYSDQPKPCPGGCKPAGRLKVIIPELKRMAYVTVLTTSQHDIMEIQANLEAASMMRNDLRGIPFVLKRFPREISTPQNGKRVRVKKWLISIEVAPSFAPLQMAYLQQTALPQVKQLTDGGHVDTSTGELIEEPEYTINEPEEAPTPAKPEMTPAEAAKRFYARYGETVGGTNWTAVQKFLGYRLDRPQTTQEWIDAGREVKAAIDEPQPVGEVVQQEPDEPESKVIPINDADVRKKIKAEWDRERTLVELFPAEEQSDLLEQQNRDLDIDLRSLGRPLLLTMHGDILERIQRLEQDIVDRELDRGLASVETAA